MRKYLIEPKKYYKANMHTHTTKSDGAMEPEEVKALYKKLGYSIVAFTDHAYMEDYNSYLSDEEFIAINGYENEVINPKDSGLPLNNIPLYHFNFFSTKKDNFNMVGINEHCLNFFIPEPKRKEIIASLDGKKPSSVTGEIDSINQMIKEANEKGFLVQYNHPVWSLQNYNYYIGLKGLWGLEVYNHSSYLATFEDSNGVVLDELAKQGEFINASAGDDLHSWTHVGGGFCYIGANELTYEAVIDAMIRKDMYASCGPTFEYIYVEDNKAYVKSSEVAKINMITDNRRRASTRFEIDEKHMTLDNKRTGNNCVFNIPNGVKYIRFELIDIYGRKAWTRAYNIEELK